MGAGGEPVDDEARGLGGLVGCGLNVAEEEGEHEESGGAMRRSSRVAMERLMSMLVSSSTL